MAVYYFAYFATFSEWLAPFYASSFSKGIALSISLSELFLFLEDILLHRPIAVAARSKAWVCGRSLAGIAGLNPAGGMDVCLL